MKKTRRVAIVLAGTFLVVLVALPIIGFTCVDRFILPPVNPHARRDGSPRLEIPHGGGVIEVFRAKSPGAQASDPRYFVLRFTDNAYEAAGFTASRWGRHPVEAWVVSFPGYGGGSGPRTLRALAEAALPAYDALSRAAGGRPILLEGFSLGTAPALYVAANRPVAGLILHNGPALPELLLRHGWWNLWLIAAPASWSIPRELDSVANAKRCNAPLVWLMAGKDSTVPPDNQQLVFSAFPGPKKLIHEPGAEHIAPMSETTKDRLQNGMAWILDPRRP